MLETINDLEEVIIIQARVGSTRLKNKMLLPFFSDKSLAEVIFSNLSNLSSSFKLVVATTTNPADKAIADIAKNIGLEVFRGSEKNVLQRFIDASKTFDTKTIVRVCADNPFINVQMIQELVNEHQKGNFDYTSFAFSDGTPTIKSHIGLFAEVVSMDALKKISDFTSDAFYLEHVTNFIYSNPKDFKVNLIQLPTFLQDKRDIRLTIDTQRDFDAMKLLYNQVYPYHQNIKRILEEIENSIDLKETMKKEILANGK